MTRRISPLCLQAAVLTHVGMRRMRNEDCIAVAGSDFARAMFVITASFLVMSISESTLGWPNVLLLFIFRIVMLRWRDEGRAGA